MPKGQGKVGNLSKNRGQGPPDPNQVARKIVQQATGQMPKEQLTVINWEKGDVPQAFAKLIQEMDDADRIAGKTYQLFLPFDQPMDLEVRVSPKKPASIRLEVEWKHKAG